MLRSEVLRAVENSLWYLEYIILVIGWPLPDMFDFLENKLFNKFFNRRRVTQTPSICNVPAYEMFSPSLSRVPSRNINHMFLFPTFWWENVPHEGGLSDRPGLDLGSPGTSARALYLLSVFPKLWHTSCTWDDVGGHVDIKSLSGFIFVFMSIRKKCITYTLNLWIHGYRVRGQS